MATTKTKANGTTTSSTGPIEWQPATMKFAGPASKTADGPIDLVSIRARMVQIRADLGACFRERSAAIECITLAALAGSHVLLVGPPGTAKSALFFGFLQSFPAARKFVTLITRFATEDEVFGPVRLSALKEDRWERNLEGRLAAVECAFMDEVFKGSDAVLNTLLSAMNERIYKGAPIPLRMMVAASNELPEEEILAAVYDRFLLRDVVEYIEGEETWMSLMASPPKYTARAFLSLEEWEAAVADVAKIELPRAVVEAMLKIKGELRKVGLVVSDRRWLQMTQVLRAAAWLDGCAQVELDHLVVLRYGLWTKPDDRAAIAKILEAFDAGAIKAVLAMIDDAIRCYEHRPSERAAYQAALPKIAGEVDRTIRGVQLHLDAGVSARARARIEPRLVELQGYQTKLEADVRARTRLPTF